MFHQGEQLGEVGAGMPVLISIGLEENASRGMFWDVGGDSKGAGEVRETKDGLRQEKYLESINAAWQVGVQGQGQFL